MNGGGPEVERVRAAVASLADRARPSAACPPVERIWSAVQGELSRNDVRSTIAHAISCPACGEAWRLAREIAAEAFPAAAPGEEEASLPHFAFPKRWVLAAAAAAAVAVLVVLPRLSADAPGYRSLAGAEVRSLLAPGTSLARDRCVLSWTGIERARYDLLVATDDLRILAEVKGLEATEYRLPESALASVPRGARIVWQLDALLPDGEKRPSRTFVNAVD